MRVRELRKAARLSGPALADRLNKLDINWTRTTVAKFETFQRQSLTVQELLALALALDVSPVLLIADPRDEGLVPITPGFQVDQWAALSWLVGAASARASTDRKKYELAYQGMNKQGGDAAWIVSNALWVGLALSDIAEMRNAVGVPALDPDSAAAGPEEQERKAFEALRQVVRRIVIGSGLVAPDLGDEVRQRAVELEIDLDVKPLPTGDG